MQSLLDQQIFPAEIPRAQRQAVKRALVDFAKKYPRDEAIALAYLSGQHTMAAIAKHFGVHYTTVSRAVKNHEHREQQQIC